MLASISSWFESARQTCVYYASDTERHLTGQYSCVGRILAFLRRELLTIFLSAPSPVRDSGRIYE
jgi:hypothetical protein